MGDNKKGLADDLTINDVLESSEFCDNVFGIIGQMDKLRNMRRNPFKSLKEKGVLASIESIKKNITDVLVGVSDLSSNERSFLRKLFYAAGNAVTTKLVMRKYNEQPKIKKQ